MNNQTQSQSVPQGEPHQLNELIKVVLLTPTQMLNLTSDDQKFTEKIVQYNQMGTIHINNEEYNEALIYLQQAEKLLEYAASCGKTIDRILITSTLQNEACAYQRLWELEKSSNYMEAIIYNMNSYLDNGPHLETSNQNSYSDPQFYEMVSLFIDKRLSIAFYYLQFSAVSSQTKKHEVALKNAFYALETLKLVCEYCYGYEKYLRKQMVPNESQSMLKTLANVKKDIELDKFQRHLKQTKRAIIKLRHRIHQKSNSPDSTTQTLKEFTIGEVMQISPITIEQMNKKSSLKNQITFINQIYKAFYISISYFAVATELRLLSAEKYITDLEKKNCQEYKKSQIYHLYSIQIAAMFSPCESIYLEHILKSFKNHYDLDLNEASSVMEVSSIDVESQNFIELDKVKLNPKEEECDFQNLQLKDHMKNSHRENGTKANTHTSEHIKMTLKRKKKKHPLLLPHHIKKHDRKQTKSNLKSKEKNHTLIKSTEQTPQGKGKRKSSLSQQRNSKQYKYNHRRILTSKSHPKEKKIKEDKSKSKSKSKSSRRKVTDPSYHVMKEKSKQKIKKKTAKLHEEYFQKNQKKKTKRKNIGSTNKLKLSQYGGEMRGTVHTISMSKMSNQQSNSKLGKGKS